MPRSTEPRDAPANTPKEAVAQLASWFTAALQVPQIIEAGRPGVPSHRDMRADFGAHLRKHYDEYGRVIRESNIRAE